MKKILGFVTDRTKEFTKYSIYFIKKWVNEIDEFYIYTTRKAYNNFFKNIIDFKHKVIFLDKRYTDHPERWSYQFWEKGLEIAEKYDDNTLIYFTGDGAFLVNNPFKYVEKYENNFNNYDLIGCIYDRHCYDVGPFFKNSKRSREFLRNFVKICQNVPNNNLLIYENWNRERKKLIPISKSLHRNWLCTQNILWNIYLKNPNINFLTKVINVKFFTTEYHKYTGPGSVSGMCSTLYDSFKWNCCLINFRGKPKYVITPEVYKYYFYNYDNKNIISKKEFMKRFGYQDKKKWKEAIERYNKKQI